ncbi:MAG: cytoplasmic protein [Chloroflexi bacterium]|nr:cytoplasmic protein [Chloroflexota bacterium]
MDISELEALISRCLHDFYERRLKKVRELKLRELLRRKNPYLFRALGTQKASEIVERLLADYISSSDETIFGEAFFEPIALIASGGTVSGAKGIDIMVETESRISAYAVKSGPNPFSSSAKSRQGQEFRELRSRLFKLQKQFDPVLAHAYGRKKARKKDLEYRVNAGQAFWQEITGDSDFYLKLVRLMKDQPIQHKDQYAPAWDATINRFTAAFFAEFCFADGSIDWEKLVEFVSAEKAPKLPKKRRGARRE